jgi:hypothetical protein
MIKRETVKSCERVRKRKRVIERRREKDNNKTVRVCFKVRRRCMCK